MMPRLRSHSAKQRRDVPSTSKQADALPTDRSEAKTPENPDRNAKTPEPERPESPQNCSICLSNIENKAFTDSCLHTFCYICLLEWSKVKAVCPLCKQPFKKIIHNVRSLDDFDEYVIPPPQPARDHLWENDHHNQFWAVQMNGARFRYRTTVTADRMADYQRRRHPAGRLERSLLAPFQRRVSREESRRRRVEATLRQRRRVYDHDMWVLPVSPSSEPTESSGYDSRYRETSPQFFSSNDTGRYTLIPWLSRELNILLHDHEDNVYFVLELVLDLIQRFEITSQEFYELIHPFLGRHTRHFIHEFYHFARSPYDMTTYDQRATYERRPSGALASGDGEDSGHGRRSSPESDDDDVMVVEDGSTDPPQTLSQVLSRSSGVPLVNIGPINVEWNLPSALGDVRSFLHSVVGANPPLSLAGSGASQMARIHSHHNYAAGSRDQEVAGAGSEATEAIDLSANAEPEPEVESTVTLRDSESEDDVIFVKYEKPYEERTPIVLSSGSDEEIVDREERMKKEERKKKSRHGSGKHRRKERRDRSRSLSRSRSRDSRSRDRTRVRDRSPRQNDRRSRSRDHRHSSSRSRDDRRRKERSRSRDGRYLKSHDRRRERRRSRSRSRSRSRDRRRSRSADRFGISRWHPRSESRDRPRSRSRSVDRPSGSRRRDRRYSSSDSVEITKVKRRRAKKHKNKHKHKKHKKHKKRKISDSSDRPVVQDTLDEAAGPTESRKCKKHPTGHKSSKRSKKDSAESESTLNEASANPDSEFKGTDAVASSGFESGDISGDSPIDVTTVDDVTMRSVENDVTTAEIGDSGTLEASQCASSHDTIVCDILNDIISEVVTKCSGEEDAVDNTVSKELTPTATELVVCPALVETDWLGLDKKLRDESWPFSKNTDSSDPGKRLPSFLEEFVEKGKFPELAKDSIVEHYPTSGSEQIHDCEQIPVDSDSDCIIDEDDDVLFECECRCRARQKCARCLKSDSSSSSSDSDSDSSIISVDGATVDNSARGLSKRRHQSHSDDSRRSQTSNRRRMACESSDNSSTTIIDVGTEPMEGEIDVERIDSPPVPMSANFIELVNTRLPTPTVDVVTFIESPSSDKRRLETSISLLDESDGKNSSGDTVIDIESLNSSDSVLVDENGSRTDCRDPHADLDPVPVDSVTCLSNSAKSCEFRGLEPLMVDIPAAESVIDVVSTPPIGQFSNNSVDGQRATPSGECNYYNNMVGEAACSSTGGSRDVEASSSGFKVCSDAGKRSTGRDKSNDDDSDAS